LQGQDKNLLKLSVFGRARVMDPDKMSAYLGKNPNWTAPEVFDQARNFLLMSLHHRKRLIITLVSFGHPCSKFCLVFFS
jgi:hypothetical protein